MSLAYLLGKSSGKILKVSPNIPLMLVLSIIPDVDILLERVLGISDLHRGPTHSIIAALIVFVPFFAMYRRKAVPHFLALASHPLVGDLLTGGRIMLFWPATSQLFELHGIESYTGITSPINIASELTLFTLSTIIMLKTRDLYSFFGDKKSNLLLALPTATVLLPTLVGFPLTVPLSLVPPHLFYVSSFSISILIVFAGFLRRRG